MRRIIDFIHELTWNDVPSSSQDHARRALLDLLGVAAAGTQTQLSRIIRVHVLNQFGAAQKGARLLFDGRRVSPVGAALAGGMLIDSVDAHDGHKLTKGHVGCGVLPALLAMADMLNPPAQDTPRQTKNVVISHSRGVQGRTLISERELLTALVIGYEIGTRAGIALHRSVSDYHTSGAWVSIAASAVAARLLKLNDQRTQEALGIAEYHGPRSQMMRCISHPTMLKDGSGWGAMSGVSAALLARDGFTGSPALTVMSDDVQDLWQDVGSNWRIAEQYHKLYPVCRWSQPAISAALVLRTKRSIDVEQINRIIVETFDEAASLITREPVNTEQAQYSLPFPVAAALVHGTVGMAQIEGEGLNDALVNSLSRRIELVKKAEFSSAFPQRRISEVTIVLNDGSELRSGPTEADGDPETPLTQAALDQKFCMLANPVLGQSKANKLLLMVNHLGRRSDITSLGRLIYTSGINA